MATQFFILGLVKCQLTLYINPVIKSFRHKGLQRFFEKDDGCKLPPELLDRIKLILSVLHAAREAQGMDLPGFRLHPLKGNRHGFYAVTVRSNWRIVFRFEDGGATDVDFIDYH